MSVKALQSMRMLVPWVGVRDRWVINHDRSWFLCKTQTIKATNASVLAALIPGIPTSCPSCHSLRVWLANRARDRSQKLHTCSDWRPVCLVQRRSAIFGIGGIWLNCGRLCHEKLIEVVLVPAKHRGPVEIIVVAVVFQDEKTKNWSWPWDRTTFFPGSKRRRHVHIICLDPAWARQGTWQQSC